MTNFINNIKRIYNNIKYVLCYDFHKLFNHINNKADKANLTKYDIVTLNKRIDFIHTKLQKYQVKDIDMMKIYIEENTKKIETLENYLNPLTKKNIFKDIEYPLIERLEHQQEEIKTLQLFLMNHNHIFRKLKDK